MGEQMSEQLKPCPFCGKTPGIDYSDALDAYVVVCEDCPANQFDDRRDGAIATWNHRPMEDAKDSHVTLAVYRAEAAEAKLAKVGRVLSRRGCECGCDHGPSEHDVECSLCYGCEIDALLNGKEATDGM